MAKALISSILREATTFLKVAEIPYPSQNIPYYQDQTRGPEDNAGGAFGLSEPYLDYIGAPPHSDDRKFPKEYNNQGERPENDSDFYTEPYANAEKESINKKFKKLKKLLMQGVPFINNTSNPYTDGESPKDGYKGPGHHERFNYPQGDPNPDELYPDVQQGGNLQY